MSSTAAKRKSTDSRMNAGNGSHESAPPLAHQNHPAAPTVTVAVLAASTAESQDIAADDKKDQGTDLSCLSNGTADPLVPASPATLSHSQSTTVSSNGVVKDAPLSDSPPTTPLASNQNTLTTIIQPSSPPSASATTPTDPAKSLTLDSLRSSRNSLTSSRPAPPSPVASRRTSAALSRCSSTRSRPNSTPNPHEPAADSNDSTTSVTNPIAQSPTTPTPQQQQQQQQQARQASSSSSVKIRDFAFPDDDARHTGLGPFTPRPNRRLLRPVSAWSASSSTSSNDDDDDDDDDGPASSSAGGSSYGFAGWGLGRLSWFGVRSGAAAAADDGGGGGGGGGRGGPSQNDFERNFEDAISPSYEIDDPYDDDDDDFDDYEDGVAEGEGEDGIERPLLPGLYRALFAFEPEGTAEMALEEDQIVRVVGRGGGVGWAIVARGGDESHALVPEGYLELVHLDQEQEQDG
jgi:hypothetical protein